MICLDLFTNWFVYKRDDYKRSCNAMERAEWKKKKAESDNKKKGIGNTKNHLKRLQRTKDEYAEACGDVARRHTAPTVWTSLFFVLLLRILGTEHGGKVIGLVPFLPMNILQRLTRRGLVDTIPYGATLLEGRSSSSDIIYIQQGASFLFVYLLTSFSVKFHVSQIFGTKPPKGADGGLMTVMERYGLFLSIFVLLLLILFAIFFLLTQRNWCDFFFVFLWSSPQGQRLAKSMGLPLPEDLKNE